LTVFCAVQKIRWAQYIVKNKIKSSNFLKKMVVPKPAQEAKFYKKTTKTAKNI
jgi:hypothetical protein